MTPIDTSDLHALDANLGTMVAGKIVSPTGSVDVTDDCVTVTVGSPSDWVISIGDNGLVSRVDCGGSAAQIEGIKIAQAKLSIMTACAAALRAYGGDVSWSAFMDLHGREQRTDIRVLDLPGFASDPMTMGQFMAAADDWMRARHERPASAPPTP